jgi:3-oxoacyl-[acyl-carrier protein] reductase
VPDQSRFLAGRTAVVTGAGRGIGRAIAGAYADAGATVVLAARTATELDAAASEIGAVGGRAIAVPTDVTAPDQVAQLFDRVESECGRLDLLVANAGGGFAVEAGADADWEAWRGTFALNVDGVFLCARAAIPLLRATGSGKILVMGSGAGRRAGPGWAAYASAKAAVSMLVRVLAQELREDRIAVNEIVPGPVNTQLIAGLRARQSIAGTVSGVATEWFKEPADVADLALFLARLPDDGPTAQTFSLLGRDM